MSWYNTQGKNPNYVLYSKARYIRSVAKQSFTRASDKKPTQDASAVLDKILTSNGFRGESTVNGVTPAILSLAERQLVERDFVYSESPRSLYLNDPCNIVIAIGGEEYISISSVTAGLSVIEAKNMASEAEEAIDRELTFAYSDKIGYLSPVIANCGSGLTLSAALYLPSLSFLGLEAERHAHSMLGMTLSPMFSHDAVDLYVLSYTPPFLCDEDAATLFFSDTVASLAEKEKSRLQSLYSDKGKELYDKARRALGSLLYASRISEREMLSHLLSIRLYHCLPTETQSASLPSVTKLNYLCAEGLNASVIATAKETCPSMEVCDELRAALVKKYLEHDCEVS